MEIRVSLWPPFVGEYQTEKRIETDHHTYSVIEFHTFLVTLVRQFDFSLPNDGREVRLMRPPGIIAPVVLGQEKKGPQLWLKVTALKNE